MASPPIVNPLPFELGQYPPREASSRPSSASDVTSDGNGAQMYSSQSAHFGESMPSESSFEGSQAGAQHDSGHAGFLGGDFEGIPTSPHDSSNLMGSNAPTPQNAPAPWIKTEDDASSFSTPLGPHGMHAMPMPIAAAKWNGGTIAYQTSATRGSMAPPSFNKADGNSDSAQEKDMFQLSSSVESFDQSDEESAAYHLPMQVQMGPNHRTSYQPPLLTAAPYSASFNPKGRPIRTLSADGQQGFPSGPASAQQLGDMHHRHPFGGQAMDMRPVPPLSSSSSTTATTSASLQNGHFPDQRTPMTAMGPSGSSFGGHNLPSGLMMDNMALTDDAQADGHAPHSGYSSNSGPHVPSFPFSASLQSNAIGWRPQTAMNGSQMHAQQLGSAPVPIGRQPMMGYSAQYDGPSMSAPAHYGFSPSSSWQSNGPSQPQSISIWRPNGESLVPKGFPKSPRKHICHQCDKRFNRPSSLQTHMSVHTGAKPYQCPRIDCQRRFSVSSNLRRHMRTHEAKIKKEYASSLDPPEYDETGEDELQEVYDGHDQGGSNAFFNQQLKYQQPFSYLGQNGNTASSFPETHSSSGYLGQHAYPQPQGMQTGTIQANSMSRNPSRSTSQNRGLQYQSDGRAMQFQVRPSYGGAATPQAISSPYSSNKQHGVRHGPSLFGFAGLGAEQTSRSRQETPAMAGQ